MEKVRHGKVEKLSPVHSTASLMSKIRISRPRKGSGIHTTPGRDPGDFYSSLWDAAPGIRSVLIEGLGREQTGESKVFSQGSSQDGCWCHLLTATPVKGGKLELETAKAMPTGNARDFVSCCTRVPPAGYRWPSPVRQEPHLSSPFFMGL